jgi:flavin reductase (DIM6/NTAB) family NADH-FMN oxidoreductase RutF
MTSINEHLKSFPATDADAFKAVARTWAATVTVCVAKRKPEFISSDKPEFDGFTATSFQTVSINPPIILVSVINSSNAGSLLRECSSFAVSLLNHSHADLAGTFAKSAAERQAAWQTLAFSRDAAQVPIFDGVAGAFSATVREFVDAGDHTLVLGNVTAIHKGALDETLVYHNRAYGRVRPLE